MCCMPTLLKNHSLSHAVTLCLSVPCASTGGRVRVRVSVKEMGIKDRLADLDVTIWGENLHAPLIERLLELPMDIYGGVCHA